VLAIIFWCLFLSVLEVSWRHWRWPHRPQTVLILPRSSTTWSTQYGVTPRLLRERCQQPWMRPLLWLTPYVPRAIMTRISWPLQQHQASCTIMITYSQRAQLSMIHLRVSYGFCFTNIRCKWGGETTPKFNKEYLWSHSTDLDHVNTIRREISSSLLVFQKILKTFYTYVYFFKY